MSRQWSLVVLGLLSAPVAAAEPSATIAPFVDQQTAVVIWIELPRVTATEIDRMGPLLDIVMGDSTDARAMALKTRNELIRAGVRELFVLVSPAEPISPFAVIAPIAEGNDPKAVIQTLQAHSFGAVEAHRQAVIAGWQPTVQRLKTLKPVPRPELTKAFAAAGNAPIRLAYIPSEDHRRVAEELYPKLPPIVGGRPVTTLTRGCLWAGAGLTISPKFLLHAQGQAENAKHAAELVNFLPLIYGFAGMELKGFPHDPFGGKLVPKVNGNQLTLTVTEDSVTAELARLMGAAQTEADRQRKMNDLKQLALAFHIYHDAHGCFPARAGYGLTKLPPRKKPNDPSDWTMKPKPDAKPLLSWRVYLLPYIEQQQLYQQFKLDEPWDSENNKKLIAKMPPIFRGGNAKLSAQGKTRIVVPVSKDTIFTPDGPGTRLVDVTDGTSNTILALEAAEESAVIWTKPDDLAVDLTKPFAGIFNKDAKSFVAAFADGSVRHFPRKIKPESLRAYLTRNGGEVIMD
jgi:hypothetical protein